MLCHLWNLTDTDEGRFKLQVCILNSCAWCQRAPQAFGWDVRGCTKQQYVGVEKAWCFTSLTVSQSYSNCAIEKNRGKLPRTTLYIKCRKRVCWWLLWRPSVYNSILFTHLFLHVGPGPCNHLLLSLWPPPLLPPPRCFPLVFPPFIQHFPLSSGPDNGTLAAASCGAPQADWVFSQWSPRAPG